MTPGANEMARRFALQHIGYWRKAPEPKSRAYHRKNALIWIDLFKHGVRK